MEPSAESFIAIEDLVIGQVDDEKHVLAITRLKFAQIGITQIFQAENLQDSSEMLEAMRRANKRAHAFILDKDRIAIHFALDMRDKQEQAAYQHVLGGYPPVILYTGMPDEDARKEVAGILTPSPVLMLLKPPEQNELEITLLTLLRENNTIDPFKADAVINRLQPAAKNDNAGSTSEESGSVNS